MRKILLLTHFRKLLATTAIAAGLVAGASLPASAHIGMAAHAGKIAREHVQIYRDFKYAPVRPEQTSAAGGPPDYCDLPSAGCESYLAN